MAKLLEQAQIHAEDTPFSDIESLFSLDDEYSPQALAVVAYSTSEEDSEPDSEYDSDLEIQTIYSQGLVCLFSSYWTKRKGEKVVATTTPIYGRITEKSYSGPSNACLDALLALAIII